MRSDTSIRTDPVSSIPAAKIERMSCDLFPNIKLYCYKCNRFWISKTDRYPKLCPLCKLSKWYVPVEREITCKVCNRKWNRGNINEPCPQCGHSSLELESEDTLVCNQCEHKWIKRTEALPSKCPLCKTTKWNSERTELNMCYGCGHTWKMRAEKPKRCPSCQSQIWDTPFYKLQCRRCGYKWKARPGKTSNEVKICPSCKSRKWNETPKMMLCVSCRLFYINRSNTPHSRCPACYQKKNSYTIVCDFCKVSWVSTKDDWSTCPRCGKPKPDEAKEMTIDFWNNERFSLRYTYTDDFSFIYLWEGEIPVATMYLHDLLAMLNITAEQFTARVSDPSKNDEWSDVADYMYEHRNDHTKYIPDLMKKLEIVEFDAAVLSLHFTGMGPEAIAVHMRLSIEEIRRSFDRIMDAYIRKNIIVNDSAFTNDPLSLY